MMSNRGQHGKVGQEAAWQYVTWCGTDLLKGRYMCAGRRHLMYLKGSSEILIGLGNSQRCRNMCWSEAVPE